MVRWFLVFVLAVASATGWAQSGQGSLMESTTRAWNASVAAEQVVASLTRQWNELNAKFGVEKEALTRLKNAPKSWRTDRELKAKLADAEALAKKLQLVSADLRRATEALAAARRTLIAAIDAELAARPSGPRKAQLDRARAMVAPQRKVQRIVLPDMQIDPYADPEDLDLQAKAIRNAEVELQNQIRGLETQAKELERIAMLRKQHDRTRELDSREDTSPRKGSTPNATRGGTQAAEDIANPTGPGGGPDTASFEMDATITLAEVVDPATIDLLNKAQRSNDPKKRADAARATRDAVQRKLNQLREKRMQVENRATQLRKGR
jgi:hypothetical protein